MNLKQINIMQNFALLAKSDACPFIHHLKVIRYNDRVISHRLGAVHKVRHARGGPRRCDSLWQGEGGQEHVTSRLYKFLSYIWNMKFKVMFNFLL